MGEMILTSYKADSHAYYNVEGKMTWSVVDYGSYANVTISAYAKKNAVSGGNATTGNWTYKLMIGQELIENWLYTSVSGNSWVFLGSMSRTVYGDSVWIGAEVLPPSGTSISGDSASGGQIITIRTPAPDPPPVVPDPSTIATASNAYFGEATRVTWVPNSADYYFKLVLACGSKTKTYSGIYPATTGTATANATVPYDFITEVSSGLSKSVSVTLTTHTASSCTSGNQVGGASTVNITCTVPDNDETKPQVTGAVFAPSPDPIGGAYIQSKTGADMTDITASGKYGASIARQYFRVEGKNYNKGTVSEPIAQFGQLTLTAYAVDSRGFTSKGYPVTVTVLPYSSPKLRPVEGQYRVTAVRCDGEGNLDADGAYLIIMARREYSPVQYENQQKNLCAIRFRYKPDTVTGWSGWTQILAGSDPEDSIATEPLLGSLSPTGTYQIEIQAIDTLEGMGSTIVTVSSDVVFDHANGALGSYGFGKFVTIADVFDVASNKTMILRGGLVLEGDALSYVFDMMHPIGSVLETVNNENPGDTLGGTWVLMETTESSTKWRRTE